MKVTMLNVPHSTKRDRLVSILVPIYNVSKYIERCARSLFEQTFENIEYIFVDDCSPDNSLEILLAVMNDYPTRDGMIKVIRHNENKGLAAARNTALQSSQGDYIMHVDSDDYVDINIVKELYKLSESGEADITVCDVFFCYESKHTIYENDVPEEKHKYLDALFSRKSMFNMFGKLYRKKFIIENSIFSIEGLNQGEDFAVYPRMVYHANKCLKLDKPLYHYNQVNTNSYSRTMTEKGRNEVLRATEILADFFSQKLQNTSHNYLLFNLKFFNKLTMLLTAPNGKISDTLTLYPELRDYEPVSLGWRHRILFYLMKHRLSAVLSVLIRFYKLKP
jgi:glycosyltransferase involved in cell wall biosynthesis